jgi:hypothetical protein
MLNSYSFPERFKRQKSNVSCDYCLAAEFSTHDSSYICESSVNRVVIYMCKRCFEKRKIQLGKCSRLDYMQSLSGVHRWFGTFKWDRDFLTD